MHKLDGEAKTIRKLLSSTRYSIDYYQREYRWQNKQVTELIEDLTNRFRTYYQKKKRHKRTEVMDYGHYFLGSIIINHKGNENFIIDGQQRLTTLTLLLIHLHNLQKDRKDAVDTISQMIYSERHGHKSFNIDIAERRACMNAIFNSESFKDNNSDEINNILARYNNIKELFPDELKGEALPYFIDWLIENVHLIEITTYSDGDAYTIFETMNDRGLSLIPTEMFKSYLLENISNSKNKIRVNQKWKQMMKELMELGKEEDSDFFKCWLRSQRADSIRKRKKDAEPLDFDRIGTEFHRWIRAKHKDFGLEEEDHFVNLFEEEIVFYKCQYIEIRNAGRKWTEGLEHIFYNARHDSTQQYQLLLAPLLHNDSKRTIQTKLRMVAIYLDIMLTRRNWNFQSTTYASMRHALFQLTKEIRGQTPERLVKILTTWLVKEGNDFGKAPDYRLRSQIRKPMLRILARITNYLDTEIEQAGGEDYTNYINYTATSRQKKQYEIEHIWADKFERHTDEFAHKSDFDKYRNRIGGLLLLPKKFNASYGDLPYAEKQKHYLSQNILARTLCSDFYQRNPGLKQFIKRTDICLKPHPEFKKKDIDARQALYLKLAKKIWDPTLIQEVFATSQTKTTRK